MGGAHPIDVRGLWVLTLGILAVMTAVAAAFSGRQASLAVLAGGGVSLIPTFLVVGRFRAWRRFARELTLGRMLAWQAGKWFLTAVLFAAVFIGYREVPVLWLFGGFIATQLAAMAVLARHN